MEEDEGDASAFHEIMGGGYSTSEEEEREEQEEENSEGEETEGRKGKKRTFISLRVKRRILLAIDSAKKEGMSQKKACQLHQIQPSQYRRWKKVEEEMKVASNQKAVTLHTGKASSIVDIEEDLLEWFWGIREKGMSVSHKMLQIEASKRCNVFRRKTEWSKVKTIERYVRKNDLVMRSTTRKSQATPQQAKQEALDFILSMRPRVMGRDQDFIINMDQTPVWFSLEPTCTLDKRGVHTVHGRKSTGDTRRVTFMATITASGKKLQPMLVFKGTSSERGGRIKREFPTYPNDMLYATQQKAWADEEIMRLWVKKVLRPYVETAPKHVVPLLILDVHTAHKTEDVRNDIYSLGVEIEYIPGGCTCLVQPVDVGIGKPLKTYARRLWEEWMIESGINLDVTEPPSRKQIAEWCSASWNKFTPDICRNAWRHDLYTWFPHGCPPRPANSHTAETLINELDEDNSDDDMLLAAV